MSPSLCSSHEHLADGRRETFVHGEALAAPVCGAPQPLQLLEDLPAGFVLPRPYTADEFLAAQRAPVGVALFGKLALDDHLRGDARVVEPRLPEGCLPTHPLEADEHVLQRVVQRVPDVQRASDVGRGDDDAIGLSVRSL